VSRRPPPKAYAPRPKRDYVKFYSGACPPSGPAVDPVVRGPAPARKPDAVPATGKFVPHAGTAKAKQTYTGGNMLGIAVRHKSGLEPVFDKEHAKDLAKMRRN
jgi:hypothetical protein